jgi:hypothetical protein
VLQLGSVHWLRCYFVLLTGVKDGCCAFDSEFLLATFLQSDHTLAKDVRTRLVALSSLTTIGTTLLIIVGISTPLGLSEELGVGDTQSVTWEYARDVGPGS